MNKIAKTEVKDIQTFTRNGNELSNLREGLGPIKSIGIAIATSRAKGEALKMIEVEKARSEANIILTDMKLAEAKIRSALVGNAMPAIGALTIRINAATAAVDQSLTNGAAAEVFTHLSNRQDNINIANELHANGKITREEADVVVSFAESDAAEDIRRSRTRMEASKEAVGSLHEFSVKGIADAKNRLI